MCYGSVDLNGNPCEYENYHGECTKSFRTPCPILEAERKARKSVNYEEAQKKLNEYAKEHSLKPCSI